MDIRSFKVSAAKDRPASRSGLAALGELDESERFDILPKARLLIDLIRMIACRAGRQDESEKDAAGIIQRGCDSRSRHHESGVC